MVKIKKIKNYNNNRNKQIKYQNQVWGKIFNFKLKNQHLNLDLGQDLIKKIINKIKMDIKIENIVILNQCLLQDQIHHHLEKKNRDKIIKINMIGGN